MEKLSHAYKNESAVSIIVRIFMDMVLAIALLSFSVEATAQHKMRFDPQRFERELEQYVVKQANLTSTEREQFLPIYREMRAKQRAVFEKSNFRHKPNFEDEKECEEAIRKHDSNEIKLKRIQRTYHNKFLTFMSAKKVLKIIRAEDEFHRTALKKVGMKGRRK